MVPFCFRDRKKNYSMVLNNGGANNQGGGKCLKNFE